MSTSQLILVVDDDVELRNTLKDFLRFEGYDVVLASCGEDGIAKLAGISPDLIILDMSMPGIGGIGFLKERATIKKAAGVPVLVFTARANMEEFFKGVDVAGFLSKPCDPVKLLDDVKRVIGSKKRAVEPKVTPAKKGAMKVLLAEDEAGYREHIVRTLADAGYNVVTVAHSPEVVEKAIVERPDIILIKLVMTGMNGDMVASLLKDMPTTSGIPVILYDHSGSSPRERVLLEKGPGLRRFIRDPGPDDILKAVNVVLRE